MKAFLRSVLRTAAAALQQPEGQVIFTRFPLPPGLDPLSTALYVPVPETPEEPQS